MTSYQKLKEENKKLKSDIYYLIMDREGKGCRVFYKWYQKFSLAKAMLHGSVKITHSDKETSETI